jgi:crotonobetainyl-CoA:carnitine CoA-transferase CaiB-like acyl-CoA transferase
VWATGSVSTPAALRADHPHLTVTAITPFGLEGPWSDRPATDLTLQAWSGGAIGLGRGSPDRAPVAIGGQIGEWMSGTYAAIGTMASWARAAGSGVRGELVDLSMLEVHAMSLTYFPVTFVDMVGRPFRTGRSSVVPGVEATSDGIVGVGVGTGQQWLDFCALVGHPEWTEDRKLFAQRQHLAPEIAAWMSEHTTAEVLELTAVFRIPHAPIGNGATIPATDHFRARGAIVEHPAGDGRPFSQPERPYRFDRPLLRPAAPAPPLGEPTDAPDAFWPGTHEPGVVRSGPEPVGSGADLPFAALRVLDLTAFWAGPLTTYVLGVLGADVIHVESTARPDGTRMLAGIRFSEPDWWEQSGVFSGLNAGKRGITLDLSTDRGKEVLHRLVATCDVVVENSTPRVLDQIGLDLDTLRSLRPDAVVVRMPGFGLDGPWRDDPAFAFVIEDAAGLTWLTGHADQNPVSPYCVGDSNAGLHALIGLLLALEHRRRTGEGVVVEAAMVDAALNIAAEQVVEHSAYGALLERDGNRGPTAAPQNLYRAADTDDLGERDSWVAVSVATDEQWLALRDVIERPFWAMDPDLLARAGRRLAHDAIDRHLAEWCAERKADEVVDLLWDAGVPVAKVLQPHEQATLPPLLHRGFFEDVEHPVTGSSRHGSLPMRLSRGPERLHRRHAPLLGEHNDEVLRALGLTDAELAQLEADGVTGRAPATGK